MQLLVWTLFVFALWLGGAGAVVAQEEDPQQAVAVVETLQDALIEAMKQGDTLGYEGRYRLVEPVVRETHDLEAIARVAVGRYWREFTPAQRARLIEAFGRQSFATYAARFDEYGGQHFEITGHKPMRRGQILVESRLVKGNGERVSFNYILRDGQDSWRIINIIVDGVSDLALKRAEYTAILESDGFDALIAKIEEKVAELAPE